MNEASAFFEIFAMGMEKELFQITEAARACGLSAARSCAWKKRAY